jgi:DNA-binding response OmpR family regulator
MTKPFSFMELMARVEAILRRTSPKHNPLCTFSFGDVVVDLQKREVRKNDTAVDLSAREFRLLKYFIDNKDEVIERDTLLDAVWDHENPPLTRTVDMHVAKLRKKLEDTPGEPRYFVTVHRIGYKFVGDD